MVPLQLRIEGNRFRDPYNREITLRGINVAGDAKYPKRPDVPSHVSENFFDAEDVSFVGRPFPIEDAPIHFGRLRKWGYNTIRYVFTWEAIEHAGPDKYDEEFCEYTVEVLRSAKDHGFYVFMDPHQDVWSRFSGGSGAPLWTLYAAGLNPKTFNKTQAALVQNTWPNPAEFPKMIWSTNYTRMTCQTMFTLFWGGKDFAPKAIINGQNIQDYLQNHFIAACKHLARKIHAAGDLEDTVVIGWESINEPHRGLIGIQDISVIPPEQQLQLGTSPTAFQALLTGSGRAVEETTWTFGSFGPHQSGKELVDPEGESAWLPTDFDDSQYQWKRDPEWKLGECLWAQHGVWDPSTDTLLRKDYFGKHPKTGETLNYEAFTNTYFLEHYRKYRDAIRSVHTTAILFCQPPVMELPPDIKGTTDDDKNMVHAVHYYDGLTLLTKHWNKFYNVDVIGVLRGKYLTPAFAVKIGESAIRNCLRDQLKYLRDESLNYMGEHPLIFTEIGIPYDLDNKYAYKTGDYSSQISAMDANHFALEGSQSNGYTLWLYMTQNTHEWGDQWNGEDLSIFSQDDYELPSAKCLQGEGSSTTSLDQSSPSFSRSQSAMEVGKITPDNIRNVVDITSNMSLPQDLASRKAKLVSDEPTPSTPGFRAGEAFVRPSAICTAGDLLKSGFDLRNATFTLSLTAASATMSDAPTEIFLPEFHFPVSQTTVSVSGGKWVIQTDEERSSRVQRLRWWHGEGDQEIKIQGVKRKASDVLNGMGSSAIEESYLEQCQKATCNIM